MNDQATEYQLTTPVVRRPSSVVGFPALLFALLLLLAGCDPSGLPVAPSPTPALAPTTLPRPTPPTASPTPTLMPVSERREIFDDVWETVRDNYLYPDYHGADWEALRNEYRPKVEAAMSAEEFYWLVDQMVVQLNDDHSIYISPWEAEEEDREEEGTSSFVGIGVITVPLDQSLLIAEVFDGSPAWRAGLRRGDHILSVEGVPATIENEDRLYDISGPEGSTVRITVRSAGKPPRELKVERRAIEAKSYPTHTRLDSDLDIGLMVITTLAQDDMDKLVEQELQQLLDEGDLSGLIIDVRGNGGGLSRVLDGILGQFVTGLVGRATGRSDGTSTPTDDDTYEIYIDKGDLYDRLKDVPLVVLVDRDTASNGEILAATLQYAKRARVVGVRSMGNTETISPYDFDDGSRLWLAEYGFQLPDGSSIEGKGVTPDAIVDVDWTEYTTENDPQIKKAVELIRKASSPQN